MEDDAKLLQQYVRDGSEPAFRTMVERHIGLVYATALRVLAGDAHAAQDATQQVFTDLARKAASLPTGLLLGGWLHQHAYFLALNIVRAENRRRSRERTAMEINAVNDAPGDDVRWVQLAPMLDEALHCLDREDREAIVLRYLQHQDVRSIGLALGTTENTAQKRIGRALEKLRGILTSRGVTVSTGLLSSALDAGAASAPVSAGLAASVSASALSGAAATTSSTLLTSTLITMTTSKIVLGVAIVIAAIGGTYLFMQNGATTAPAAPAKMPAPIVSTAKVEAPKLPPAPAGGGTATTSLPAPASTPGSGILEVTDPISQPAKTLLLTGANGTNSSGTLQFSAAIPGYTPGNGVANVLADWPTLIADKRSRLEALKATIAQSIERRTAEADGDPAKLADLESVRQYYASLVEQENGIDALKTDPAARAALIVSLRDQLEEVKGTYARALKQATAQAYGDPAKLVEIDAARTRFADYLQKQQQAIDALEARAGP